jgi:cytosine/creatinine deaminase
VFDFLLRNVRLPGQQATVDIGIHQGLIVQIGDLGMMVAHKEVDGENSLVLPPFVESHIHLDTILTAGEPRWNESGTLFEGIRIWGERKMSLTREDVMKRALQVLRSQLSMGILHVRSQVDISDPNLTALKALLEVKQLVAPIMNLQIIAFPQEGIIACPANQARLEEALKLGVDGVGAIPHFEPTREAAVASLHYCYSLAEKYNAMVHLFCDEIDDPHSRNLEVAAYLAMEYGMGAKVTASHANATGYYHEAYFQKLLGLLVNSKINIVCCPLINSAMQGRFDAFPKGRGIARIKEMWLAGVNVSIAHDDIRSPFYPLGTGNMLQAAHMAVHLAHMTGIEEMKESVRMITDRAAITLQVQDRYGVRIGCPADMVVLQGDDLPDLLRLQPVSRYVISGGEVVAETIPAVTHFAREGFWNRG